MAVTQLQLQACSAQTGDNQTRWDEQVQEAEVREVTANYKDEARGNTNVGKLEQSATSDLTDCGV